MDVLGVSDYIETCHRKMAILAELESRHVRLLRICFDMVRQSEQHEDETGDYLHYIESGTWQRLVAAVSEPVQPGLFKKGDEDEL